MDLNHLYFQQQLSSIQASVANDRGEQLASQNRANDEGRLISDIQSGLNAAAAATWAPLRAFSVSRLTDLPR